MSIIINYGSETQIARVPTEVVEFVGRPGRDYDPELLAFYLTRDEANTRFAQNEAQISLNAEQILLRVTRTEFDIYGNRLGQAETLIRQNATDINLRATITSVDILSGRVTSAEASINVNAREILLKASQSSVDTLTGRTTVNEANISIMSGQIALTATKTELNSLGQIVNSHTASININSEQIALKASQSSVDGLTGRMTSAEASININSQQIELKATKTSVDTLTGRVTTAEGTISVQGGQIALKASQSSVDSMGNRLNAAEASINVNANEISARVLTTTFNALNQRVGTAEASITVQAGQITNMVTKTTFNLLDGSVSSLTTRVIQTEDAIRSMATSTTINQLTARVATNESSIEQLATQISFKVNQSVVDTLTQRVSTTETSLSIMNGQIVSKVSATDFNGANIVSYINQSAASVKISAKNIQLDGLVTAKSVETSVAFPKLTINKDNDNAFKIWYANGQLGIEAVAGADGIPTLRGYDPAGNKRWDLAANATQIVFVNFVPDENMPQEITKVLNVTGTTLNATEKNSIIGAVKMLFQYQTLGDPEPGTTHAVSRVFIDNQPFTNAYRFSSGIPATNAEYNGYHIGGDKTSPWIADGWYVSDGTVGNKYHPADYDDTNGPQVIYVEVMAIQAGKRVGGEVIQVPV